MNKIAKRASGRGESLKALPMSRPLCFNTQADFDAWMKESLIFAATANVNPKNFCVDCLPEFQARMIAGNRCAYPEVTFTRTSGGIFGRRPPFRKNHDR